MDPSQDLYKLGRDLDLGAREPEFCALYGPDKGRPGFPIRLMAVFHLLSYTLGLLDVQVVAQRVLNPYWHYFCGEEYFHLPIPIRPSLMTRGRKRIG
jgi:hypothetical protein